jgi:hypothetical protein
MLPFTCTNADDVERSLKGMENQEILCYLVGEISRKVVNKLYEKGVM